MTASSREWRELRRRGAFAAAGRGMLLAGMLVFAASPAAAQQGGYTLLRGWLIWSDADTMVVRHLTDQAIGHLDRRKAEVDRLDTREHWLARQRQVREALERVIGGFAHENPLNPRVTGVVQKDGYRIEKIVFESLPRMYVTGCLLIPDGIAGRAPAILYTAGSSINTFRRESYQQHILNLVNNGFIVLAIDPIGQGERIQYYDAATGRSTVSEFNHAAHQCYLIGSSYAKYYVRDAMRAIDYLCTRPEVDPERIGMGGLSWGGWQCTIVSALDQRVAAAASAAGCNVGVRRWLQSIGPTSAGQNYPGFLTAGLDHGDFFALIAPRAFLRMSTTRDYKSIQGARETYDEYRRAFEALGAPHKLDATEDDAGHGYTPKNNEAAIGFYRRHLAHPGPAVFEPVELMSEADTRITPTGQVVTSFEDAASAFDFNREEALGLLARLDDARQEIDAHLAGVKLAAPRLAGIELPRRDSADVFLGRHRRGGYAVEMYVLQGEAGYVIPLLLLVPEGAGRRRAVIYVHPDGKGAGSAAGGEVLRLVQRGWLVAVPDVAGTGETLNSRGGGRALQYIAFMINRSLVGLQAADVIRVRGFLQSHPEHQVGPVGAVGVGEMGPALLHAAALDAEISGLVLVEAPLAYRAVVLNRHYRLDVSAMVAGALTAYDLPDLMACLAPRRLALVAPRDEMLNKADAALVEQELALARAAYERAGAAANLVVTGAADELGTTIDWSLER